MTEGLLIVRNFVVKVTEALFLRCPLRKDERPVRLEHLEPFARRLLATHTQGGVPLNVFQRHTSLLQAADKLNTCQVVFVKNGRRVV